MRLFPGDDVPGLAALPQEMPAPWLMPRGLSRPHRDRLGAMVVRAVRAFDPRVRCVQIRWAEAPLLREGQIRVPERALVWWRMDSAVDEPKKTLREAPRMARAMHLLDFDGNPGVAALGWLAPLKVRLLHKLTDVLVGEGFAFDPEPLVDVLEDAAERLVSPVDLLDLTERLVEARAMGMSVEDARAEAIAMVLAARLLAVPGSESRQAATLEGALFQDSLTAEAHAFLYAAGLAEHDPKVRLPVLDWLAFPGVYSRTVLRLSMVTQGRAGEPSAWTPDEPMEDRAAQGVLTGVGPRRPRETGAARGGGPRRRASRRCQELVRGAPAGGGPDAASVRGRREAVARGTGRCA